MKLILVILLLAAPAMAQPGDVCKGAFRVESAALSTTLATEFSTATVSVTNLPGRKQVCIFNLDSTAANHVWVSSFNVTLLAQGAIDTAKSFPIPGGNTADSVRCFNWGAAIRFWLHRVTNTSRAAVVTCE